MRRAHRTFLLKVSVCSAYSVGEFLSRRFCVFREIRGRLSQWVRGYGRDAIPSYVSRAPRWPLS